MIRNAIINSCRLIIWDTISATGLKPIGEKVQAILSIKTPSNINELCIFLRMASYYWKSIRNFSTVAKPLTQLTQKEKNFVWGADQQKAFLGLKLAISTCPILQFPRQGGKFCILTDASNMGLEATLTQCSPNGCEFIFTFANQPLLKAE